MGTLKVSVASPDDWSLQTEVEQLGDSGSRGQCKGYQLPLLFLTMQECPLQPIGVQPSGATHGHGFWSQMDPDSDSYRL